MHSTENGGSGDSSSSGGGAGGMGGTLVCSPTSGGGGGTTTAVPPGTAARLSGGNVAGVVSAATGSTALGTTGPGTAHMRECAGCGKRIVERYLLKALDLYWHEDCLKCGCCDCRLGEVGSTLYTKANLILCKRDYLRLFGTTGYCAACNKVIPAFEMVMRAKNNVYHLECFACQQCNHRFCVGDRFYLCENKILCEYDYEERLVFANMAYNPSSLAHIRSAKITPAAAVAATSSAAAAALQTAVPPHHTHHRPPLGPRRPPTSCPPPTLLLPAHPVSPPSTTPAPHDDRDGGSSGYGSPDPPEYH